MAPVIFLENTRNSKELSALRDPSYANQNELGPKLQSVNDFTTSVISGFVHNQKSDPSRFVRRDRSSPMKKNACVRFITMTHTVTSLYPIIPQSL